MYPADHNFIFFSKCLDLKTFFINISKNPEILTKCTPRALLNVSTTLGNMLKPFGPALGRKSGLQGNTPILSFSHHLTAVSFEVALIPRSETVGICGIKCCIPHTILFKWQYTTWNKTCSIFFSAFHFYCKCVFS